MNKKTTMTDIARALGVSQTLVSFVLSGKNDMGISAETKRKVLKTAEKMGYCQSVTSRMLRLGRSGYTALVFFKDSGNALSEIIGGINEALTQYGYSLILVGNPKGERDFDNCEVIIKEKRADGFLIFGNNPDFEKKLSDSSMSFVVLDGQSREHGRESAARLCELILSCVEDSSKNRKKSYEKKSIQKPKQQINTEKEEKAEQTQTKKNELIWLL